MKLLVFLHGNHNGAKVIMQEYSGLEGFPWTLDSIYGRPVSID